MQESVSIKLKAQVLIPQKLKKDTDERTFWTVATSQVVDTQKEIIDMKYIKALLPVIKARGMAVNLGHFGFNVGHTQDVFLKTFGEIIKAFPKNKKVRQVLGNYPPETPAMVAKGKIYKGNNWDDIAWKMVQNGEINGSSVGLKLTETDEILCDTGGCGKVMKAESAMFELALTGKDLDFPIKSYDPSNPTSLILAYKSALGLKAAEHAPKGGITLGGKEYRGGEFIPKEDLEEMSKEDRNKLEEAQDEAGTQDDKPRTGEHGTPLTQEEQQKLWPTEEEKEEAKKKPKEKPKPKKPKDLQEGDPGYDKDKPWKNRASSRRIAKESREALEKRQNTDKPWKNRTDEERIEWFEKDVKELTKQIEQNEKAQDVVKEQLVEMVDDDKKPSEIKEKQEVLKEFKKEKNKMVVQKQMGQHDFKLLKQAGNDMRKFLAQQMGLPDTQLDKIMAEIEEAKVRARKEEAKNQKDKQKKIESVRERAKKLRERREADKKRNVELDAQLSDTIKDMKPHEVNRYVDTLFKAHLKRKQEMEAKSSIKANTDICEKCSKPKVLPMESMKAKFDKYTVDPSQIRGRPRKEKGEPQTEKKQTVKHAFLDKSLPKYGSKFEGYQTPLKDESKKIRKDLNFLKDAGFKVGVRTRHGTSIDISLTPPKDFVAFNPHYDQQKAWEISVGKHEGGWDADKDPREVYTEEGKKLLKLVNAIGKQYNMGNEETRQNHFFLGVDIVRPRNKPKTSQGEIERKKETQRQEAERSKQKERTKIQSEIDELKKQLASLKSYNANTDESMSEQKESQDAYPPHGGEFANAQIMKMLASVIERIQVLENMQQAQPAVQPQQPMQQAPAEAQPQIPTGDEAPPMDEEGEEESPFAEEGEEESEEEETPFAETSEEGEDEEGDEDEESEDEEEDEDFEEDEDEDEDEWKSKKKNSLSNKVDSLNAKMDALIGTDDDEDVVATKVAKDMIGEDEHAIHDKDKGEHEHEYDEQYTNKAKIKCLKCGKSKTSLKSNTINTNGDTTPKICTKCEKPMSTETDAVSTKADKVETENIKTKSADVEVCECGEHNAEPTGSEKETKPSMKSEDEKTESNLTEEKVAELLKKQLEVALKSQREEIYEKLGVTSTETPITAVDGQSEPAGALEEEGVTLAEVVEHFSKQSGTPAMGNLLGFVETKGGV